MDTIMHDGLQVSVPYINTDDLYAMLLLVPSVLIG